VTDVLSVLAAVALAFGTMLQQRRATDFQAVLTSHVTRVSAATSSPAAQGGG
jgi:hypothetical protein